MKKVIISIGIVLVALAIGIASLIWFFSLRNYTPTMETPNTPEQKPSYSEKLAKEREQNNQNAIIYNKAITSRNSALCTSISDEKKKTECQDTLTAISAEASGSLEMCDTITSTGIALNCRDAISQNLALGSGNKTTCDTITDPAMIQHCRESIDEKVLQSTIEQGTATEAFCKTLEEKFQADCLAAVKENSDQAAYARALASNNLVYCTIITDATLKTTCSDTILLKLALTNNSASECNRIVDEGKRTYCTAHIESKNEATLFKEYIANSNLDGCATLSDSSLKNRCHDMVTLTLARTNKDPSLCNTLTNTGMTAMCQQSAQ